MHYQPVLFFSVRQDFSKSYFLPPGVMLFGIFSSFARAVLDPATINDKKRPKSTNCPITTNGAISRIYRVL